MKKGLALLSLCMLIFPQKLSAEEIGYLPVSRQEAFAPNLDFAPSEVEKILESRPFILPAKDAKVTVDIASQKMCVSAYGNECAIAYPVSTGANDTPTPTGEWKIWFKQKLRVAGGETPYQMPYYMSLRENGEYGLHALPFLGKSHAESVFWSEARSHIGIPVSHGCVRLLTEDIEKLYRFLPEETPVIIK